MDQQNTNFLNTIKLPRKFYIATFVAYIFSFSLQGLGIAMIIPLARGLIDGDYSFIFSNVVVEQIVKYLGFIENLNNEQIFIMFAVGIVLLNVISMTINYFLSIYLWKVKQEFSMNASYYILKNYFDLGSRFYIENKKSDIYSRIRLAPEQLNKLFNQTQEIIRSGFEFMTVLILMIFISFKLFGLSLVFLLFTAGFFLLFRKHFFIGEKRTIEADTDHQTLVQDIAGKKPLVNFYNTGDKERSYFYESYKKIINNRLYLQKAQNIINPLFTVSQIIAIIIAVIFLGSSLLVSNNVSIAGAFVSLVLINRGMNKTRDFTLSNIKRKIHKNNLFDLLKQIINSEIENIESGDKEFVNVKKSISVKNLYLSYDKQKVLGGISFEIPHHQMTFLIGPNGSGKSSFINLLMRLRSYDDGQILIDGIPIQDYSAKSIRKNTAYVSQQANFFSDSIYNNLIYGLDRKVNYEEVEEALEKVGLLDFINKLPDGLETDMTDDALRFSGGQRQRLAIASALLRNTELIIFDEATKSIDLESEKIIFNLLEDELSQTTRIIVTHNRDYIDKAHNVIKF